MPFDLAVQNDIVAQSDENRLQPRFARIVPEHHVQGHTDIIAVSLADHNSADELAGHDESIAWRRIPFLDEIILQTSPKSGNGRRRSGGDAQQIPLLF